MTKRYKIIRKRRLTADITQLEIAAPLIAAKVKAGQFVILRVDADGERIPLTVSQKGEGTIIIVFQKVGLSTRRLDLLNVGDCLADLVGPLGDATHVEGYRNVAVVGGGLGSAIALPVAQALFDKGAHVDLIAGFRSKSFVILQEEMEEACTQLHICTDDGSYGYNGFTTTRLESLIKEGRQYDCVFAIGPLIMMKLICQITKAYEIPTIVSMNPIMVDGTGMCGGCRVTVGGEVRFACVDGPDFDGHQVDFDECIARNATYKAQEAHACNLLAQAGEEVGR